MSTTIQTKYGTANVDKSGYYIITSNEKGNRHKKLHRLIFEDYYQIKLPKNIHIHHEDEDKTNNTIWNLIPMTNQEHARLHHKNKIVSDETRQKISDAQTGKTNHNYGHLTEEHSLAISKSRTTTGFFRLTIEKKKESKQGFIWRYKYYDEDNNIRYIRSVDLMKLLRRVLNNGLEWRILDIVKAKETCRKFGYDFEELCKYAGEN